MEASHEHHRHHAPGFLSLLQQKSLRKRLCYGFYAMSLQQFGGIAAVTMYATLIYQSLGWNNGSQALAINGIQAVLQLLLVLVNTSTVDRYGRKQLLIAGFSIQALALLILSSLTTAFPENDNKAAAIVEIAMLFIVGMTYCWSNGPIPPTIASEIFPQHVRDKAFGVSALGQTVFLIAITQPWPSFNGAVGPLSYWLLFGLNSVALISVIIILPEYVHALSKRSQANQLDHRTKGISLERMDKIFGEVDAVDVGEQEVIEMNKGKTGEGVHGKGAEDTGNCHVEVHTA